MTQTQRDAVTEALGYEVEDDQIEDALTCYNGQNATALRSKLKKLNRQLKAQGGRGVLLADEIDRLRICLAARQKA